MSSCPNCQQETGPADAYCPKCGQALNVPPREPAAPPPPPPYSAEPEISEAEWRAYLGKNADYYLGQFPRFRVGGTQAFAATWNWSAFLATFWWFLYRKQYLFFALGLVGMFMPYVKWLVWIACGIAGNYLYYIEARRHIVAFKLGNPGRDVTNMLAQVGGVHAWVPPVAVVASVAIFLAMFIMMALVGGMFMGFMLKSMDGVRTF